MRRINKFKKKLLTSLFYGSIKNKTAKGPFEIKPQKESVWACMCGLSKNQPFCDGTHKKALDEPDDKIYEYDEQDYRREVK
mgnify:CR=1 FL=1